MIGIPRVSGRIFSRRQLQLEVTVLAVALTGQRFDERETRGSQLRARLNLHAVERL